MWALQGLAMEAMARRYWLKGGVLPWLRGFLWGGNYWCRVWAPIMFIGGLACEIKQSRCLDTIWAVSPKTAQSAPLPPADDPAPSHMKTASNSLHVPAQSRGRGLRPRLLHIRGDEKSHRCPGYAAGYRHKYKKPHPAPQDRAGPAD